MDLPDSDRGDFSCRRAVDSSSFTSAAIDAITWLNPFIKVENDVHINEHGGHFKIAMYVMLHFLPWVCVTLDVFLLFEIQDNSLRSSDAYIRQQTTHYLVQIMACHLAGVKPLSEPMLGYL